MSSNKSDTGSRPGTGSGGDSRPLTPQGPIKKQSSFASLSNMFSTKSSSNLLPTSPKDSSKKRDVIPPPEKPPASLGRQDLKEFLLNQDSNPSLDGVVTLGNMCFDEISGRGLYPRNPEMCHHTSLLLEWANQKDPNLLTATEHQKRAYAHYHAWCNSGIVAEHQHLIYARSAYESILDHSILAADSSSWLDYAKVLMHLGEADLGVKTITTMMRKFQNDGNSSLYHLTAGAMLSSVGKYEQAGHYFFETIQLGLPKFFTKSDLMFILSRSFEQLGYETKTDANDPVEDGYVMVFTHMLSETGGSSEDDLDGGLERGSDDEVTTRSAKDMQYEDWIGSFETWRNIGDKCAMHGLFNLAADFYGQGLVRDSTAFSRASLWFRFAKSCFRCARTSDAQLAVKQAVTLDPNNSQCSMALDTWSSYSNNLVEAIEEGPLSDILKLLPEERSLGQLAAMKIQAIYRGARSRVLFNTTFTNSSSIAFFDSLKASLTMKVTGGAGMRDTVRTFKLDTDVHWKGAVRFLTYFNQDTEACGKLKFQTPFNLPMIFVKKNNTYVLTIRDESEDFSKKLDRNKPLEHKIVISFMEKETNIFHERVFHLVLNDHNELILLERSVEVINNIPKPEPVVKAKKVGSRKNVKKPEVDAKKDEPKKSEVVAEKASVVKEEPVVSQQTKPVDKSDDASLNIKVIEDSSVVSEETKQSFVLPPSPDKSDGSTSASAAASLSLSSKGKSMTDDKSKSQKSRMTLDNESESLTHASNFNDSMSAVSWNENDDDDSSSVAASIHSLFKPYRSRKGCYSYYGSSFLYNASITSSIIPSVTAAVVPSAMAMKRGNITKKNKGYLRVDVMNAQSENKYLFLLPLNLAALDSIHDIIPLLLLVLHEVPAANIDSARRASLAKVHAPSTEINLEELIASLTPRRHGLHVYGGKLQLLAEVSPGVGGEIVLALNEESNLAKLQHHKGKAKKLNNAPQNASNVLNIHYQKSDAWLFLQGQVAAALDCDNASSFIDPSLESSTDAGISTKGGGAVGTSGLIDRSLHSKDSFVNDLERSLHNKHRHNTDGGDSDDNVSVLTFTDDYDEARKKAEARAIQEEEAKKTEPPTPQVAVEKKKEVAEEKPSTGSEEDPEVVEARLLAEELARIQAENMAKLKAAQLAAQQAAEEEERRRKEEEEANEEARRLEEEAIFAALHPEMGLNTVIEISENDLVPIDVLPDNEIEDQTTIQSYKSMVKLEDDEADMAFGRVDDDNNIQAAFFLAFQVQRLETLEFLKACGSNAKTKWNRQDAFNYLQKRVEDARANPVAPRPRGSKIHIKPNTMKTPSNALEIDVTAGEISPPEPQSLAYSDDGISCLSHESRVTAEADGDQSVKSSKSRGSQKSKSRFTPKSRMKPGSSNQKSPSRTPGSPKSVEPYSFNNKNKAMASAGSTGNMTPTPSLEEQREEIWKAQMESKLEYLLDDQLTNEDFTSNPSELVKVLHEFSDDGILDNREASEENVGRDGVVSFEDDKKFTRSKSSGNVFDESTSLNKLPDIYKSTSTKPSSQGSSRPHSSSTLRRPSVFVRFDMDKIKDWEEKVANLTLSNKLNARGQGNANPVYFLEQYAKCQAEAEEREEMCDDDERDNGNTISRASTAGGNHIDDYPLETMFNNSIVEYHRTGYSTGTCAYLTIWKAKIRHCVRSYETLNALNKSIVSLRKAYTGQITKSGALCALAHTNGSVGESLGQLLDKNFKEEVLLVCQALPVDEVILRIEKSVAKDKNANEFAVKTIEYDTVTNNKIIKRMDSFPLPDETAYLKDMHCPFPTEIARGSPNFGLTANDDSVRIRSSKMPVLVPSKSQEKPVSPDGRKVDTITGFPVIMTSPVPSPVPPHKQKRKTKKVKALKKTTTTKMGKSGGETLGTGTAMESGGRYIRLNDAINIMADETSNFAVVGKLQATRAREEHLLLKYHPQPNSYYRSSKQKQIMAHKQKKQETMRKKGGLDTMKGQQSQQSVLSIDVD